MTDAPSTEAPDPNFVTCGIDGCDFAVERGEGRDMALHREDAHAPRTEAPDPAACRACGGSGIRPADPCTCPPTDFDEPHLPGCPARTEAPDLRTMVLTEFETHKRDHGESCDCDLGIVIGNLCDAALRAATPAPERLDVERLHGALEATTDGFAGMEMMNTRRWAADIAAEYARLRESGS